MKVKSALIVFCVVFLFLSSCGGGSDTSNSTPLNNNSADLLGTWEKPCELVDSDPRVYTQTQFSYSSKGELVIRDGFYSDSNCTNSNGDTIFQRFTFKTGNEITMTDGVTAREIENDHEETIANGAIQDIRLETIYDIYLVQGTMFYTGLGGGKLNEEDRADQLDYSQGAIKISNEALEMPVITEPKEYGRLSLSGDDSSRYDGSYNPTISSAVVFNFFNDVNSTYIIAWVEMNGNIGDNLAFSLEIEKGIIYSIKFHEYILSGTQLRAGGSWTKDCIHKIQACGEDIVISYEERMVTFTDFELDINEDKNELATSQLILNGALRWPEEVPPF